MTHPVPSPLYRIAKLLFLGLWFLEVLFVVLKPAPELVAMIRPVGAYGLLLLAVITIPIARRATLLVTGVAVMLGAVIMLYGVADRTDVEAGLAQALLFAGFLPTLHMLRATAQAQSRVRLSQRRFAHLPTGSRRDGITLGAHAFGSVLNTGSFPVMAAVMRADADDEERRQFALASLRGMNLAPLWSPFFVAMALSSAYLPGVSLLAIMPVGLVIASVCLVLSVLWFGSRGRTATGELGWMIGIRALQPIALGLAVLGLTVVSLAAVTPLGSLETIIIAVPPLCLLLLGFKKPAIYKVWRITTARMDQSYDDLMIVVAAITIASLAGQVDVAADLIRQGVSTVPAPIAIGGLIMACFLPAMIGIHPMIPTAILLAALTTGPQPLADVVLMGVALTGWSAGTMCSVSSMSVVVCSGLFRVPAWRLMVSANMGFALAVISIATLVLSALQFLLTQFP
ncbi:MAG: hypothetical protein AAF213_05755 [Pseudomonadota bacterium]